MPLSLKIEWVYANLTDSDDMLHHAAFHLVLYCLSVGQENVMSGRFYMIPKCNMSSPKPKK